VAAIYTDPGDVQPTAIAAGLLADDVRKVTGRMPRAVGRIEEVSNDAILIGTIGHSAVIDRLIADKRINVMQIRNRWEHYLLQVIERPLPNVRRALVIVGSDPRGTAYGALTVSEAIGVSPWHWWMDEPAAKKNALFVRLGETKDGPLVKYRGMSLDAKSPTLRDWAKSKCGGMNDKFYAHVFELLLRLKANFLWSSAQGGVPNLDTPESSKLANDWSIFIDKGRQEPLFAGGAPRAGSRELAPRSLFLDSCPDAAPAAKVWAQMNAAYQRGDDQLWIVDAGNFKGMEFAIEFVLTTAWAPGRVPKEHIEEFARRWAGRALADSHSDETARLVVDSSGDRGAGSREQYSSSPIPASGPSTLRRAAGGRLLVGAAVMADQLDDLRLAALVAEQFNCVTPENEMKPEYIQPAPGEFEFRPADRIVAFAESNGMKVVGHTLCWHNQSPAWLYQDQQNRPLPRTRALENLRTHVTAVVGHFKGRVLGWDVVNEAISDNPNEYLRDTPARRAIGDDYIARAFEFARAADPGAELYYNDYGNENAPKRDKAIRLVRELRSNGIRIDGIGIQGHFGLGDDAPNRLDEAIVAYAAAGLKVAITELDVDVLPRNMRGADVSAGGQRGADTYRGGLPPDVAKAQAEYFGRIFAVVLKHRADVGRVTFWGTHDGTSWLNEWPAVGRTNHPLLWDRNLRPKPALRAVLEELGALTAQSK
jgi:endo-1,4-beta-xylanase